MNEAIADRCRALSGLAREVHVLGALSWPDETVQRFLEGHRLGKTALPEPSTRPTDLSSVRVGLDDVCLRCDMADPLEAFISRTARSYERAAAMLESVGTPAFTALSRELYQHPRAPVVGANLDHLSLARHVLSLTDELRSTLSGEEDRVCLTAEAVRDDLQDRVAGIFPKGSLSVVVDSNLASKAAASGRRVRIRGQTCFSAADVDQLAEHEIFVHSATQRNGEAQPILTALGLGAPRTTATQEGLATFSELMTGAMDLSRLRRIALRVEAVDRALCGADFVEVFRFFCEAGQSDDESARSAMRIFRGGDVRGGVAFTKDCVYLPGLVAVHTFFRSAIAEGRPDLIERLFVGRLSIGDVIQLESAFDDGRIVRGEICPAWVSDPRRIAATLAFSVAVNGLRLGKRALADLSKE